MLPSRLRALTCACALAIACSVSTALSGESHRSGPAFGRIEEHNGYPVFAIAGKPFFVYGAAFFYERIPRDRWEADLHALRTLGVNTLDLYVIWNWHETADGAFDFDGHTNPRRDLAGLLRLARDQGFAVIVRPGPVIRNEWRNAGYPAWLLRRPEYGMPEHDLLEGRYPPTATLQNAHSDDAAAQWMGNATHMTYARRWLERALDVVRHSGVTVAAVALDDDQGAYIDNQTWPAPHLTAYLRWLQGIVRPFTPAPTFINTYEMKVTASSPVWAMGNWYQSDAYAIGDHDRVQLAFSAGLLQTQERGPLLLSEFQAGWLEQPGDVLPRPADPTNTSLAIHTLLGMGLHGLVNFPAQDTMYPAGWDVPFANSFYAWDAALALDGTRQARAMPTRRIGGLVATFGPALAATHVAADAAIAYTTSAYPAGRIDATRLDAIVAATMQAQEACRTASLACDLVDLRFASRSHLRRYPVLFVPQPPALALTEATAAVRAKLAGYRRLGGILVPYSGELTRATIERALVRAHRQRSVIGFPGATLLRGDDGDGAFLVAANYDARRPIDVTNVSVAVTGGRVTLPRLHVAPRGGLLVPIGVPLRSVSRAFHAGDVLDVATCGFDGVDALAGGIALRVDAGTTPCTATFRVAGKSLTVAVLSAPNEIDVAAAGAAFAEEQRPDPTTGGDSATPNPQSALPVRHDVSIAAPLRATVDPERAEVYSADVYADGFPVTVLQNDLVRVIVSPSAGGRAFVFEDLATGANVFTTVGALRDDTAVTPPASPVDYIAKYTHQFPAGTFNRPYAVEMRNAGRTATATLSYDAPDALPNGARFEKTLTLRTHSHTFAVDERGAFAGTTGGSGAQRVVTLTSLAVGDPHAMSTQMTLTPDAAPFAAGAALTVSHGHALGFYDRTTHEFAAIAWRAGDVESATLESRPDSVVARLVLAAGRSSHSLYDDESAPTVDDARMLLTKLDAEAQGR